MTQPQIELLPCPFCGSDRLEVDVRYVSCKSCGADGPYNEGDSIQNSIDLWHTAQRPSSQVAPGLRDAIRLAIAEDNPDHYPPIDGAAHWGFGLSNSSIDRCADIAYTTVVNQQPIAAAQGGTVDRVPKCAQCQHTRTNHEHLPIDGLISPATYCGYPDCPCNQYYEEEAAVPSAPGAERVKAAWAALDNDLDARAVMINDFYSRWIALKGAIDALGTPQGSDTLRWTTELPTNPGEYHVKDTEGTTTIVQVFRQGQDLWYWAFGSDDECKLDNPVMRTMEFQRIPEPAQPVDAGEAKERE